MNLHGAPTRSDVAIRRLRLHGSGEPLRLRLAIDRLCATADVRPRRLPPAAILVVRRLHDPHPQMLDPHDTAASLSWEQAVAHALDDRLLRAARPATRATGDVDTVVFADHAELLACLAMDWSAGRLMSRWWWSVLRLASPPLALRAFRDAPAAVPAALAHIERIGSLTAWAHQVPPPEAAALVRAIAATFGATAVADAALGATASGREPDVPVPDLPRLPAPRQDKAPRSPPHQTKWLTPWEGAGSSVSSAGLALEQEVLLRLGLALRHTPTRLRDRTAVQEARRWRAAHTARSDTPRIPPSAAPDGPTPPDRGRETRLPPTPPATSSTSNGHARDTGAAGSFDPDRTAVPSVRPPPDGTLATSASPPTPDAASPPGEATGSLADVVETKLGGLFHLVLIAQRLGLYSDFTTPARPGIVLNIWDFVTLLGRELTGPFDDQVWALLADLAGRSPDEQPGAGLRPPRAWRVPRRWLTPMSSDGRWRHSGEGGRLRLVHPLGFSVVDAEGADLRRELRRYHVPRSDEGAEPASHGKARQRWVANLAAYVRVRLAVALNVRPAAAVALALHRPARVIVTDTRIDVVSALDDLPIEVRLAGLDRDLGFIPAAGLSLYFQFR